MVDASTPTPFCIISYPRCPGPVLRQHIVLRACVGAYKSPCWLGLLFHLKCFTQKRQKESLFKHEKEIKNPSKIEHERPHLGLVVEKNDMDRLAYQIRTYL